MMQVRNYKGCFKDTITKGLEARQTGEQNTVPQCLPCLPEPEQLGVRGDNDNRGNSKSGDRTIAWA